VRRPEACESKQAALEAKDAEIAEHKELNTDAVNRCLTLEADNERLRAIADAGEQLYLKCHNMKTVTPRWTNDSVCLAMQEVGKALAAVEDKE
jgi:hypothetical protein